MLEARFKLQDAATTAAAGTAIDAGGQAQTHTFYIETSNATVSAGAVTLETARTTTFAGTWAPLTTAITPVQNAVSTFTYTGALLAVRARVSTSVTGGATVTVEYVANI